MRKRFAPEKISGIVALSYLVLIPIGAFLAHQKIKAMDEDIQTLWDDAQLEPQKAAPVFNLAYLKKLWQKK